MSRSILLSSLALSILVSGCEIEPDTTIEVKPGPPANKNLEMAGWTRVKVVGVIDGDTIDVLTDSKEQHRLRIAAIDAPETGQPFGNTAKKYMSELVFGEKVFIKVTDTDRYDRKIASVIVNLKDVRVEMLKAGLAWHYVEYSDDEDLAVAEKEARSEKRGLWSDPRHVAPWGWRKLSKEERDKLR